MSQQITKAKSELMLLCWKTYMEVTGQTTAPRGFYTSDEWQKIAKEFVRQWLPLKLAAMNEKKGNNILGAQG